MLATMRLRHSAPTESSPGLFARTEVLLGGAFFLLLLGGCGAPTTQAPESPAAAGASSAPIPAPAAEPTVAEAPAAGPTVAEPPVAEPNEQVASGSPSTEATGSVEVVGIYEQLNVRKKAGAPPHYVGRAVVTQKDGQRIMIETHERGVRAAEEIAAFEGKLVRVKAAHTADRCLGWGNGTQAAIVGPCVRGIVEISLVSR
jgi:hypothetical protein